MRYSVGSFFGPLFSSGLFFALLVVAPAGLFADPPETNPKTPVAKKSLKTSKGNPVPISPGQCLPGSLEPGDEMFTDGTYFDRYKLLWPGGLLRITLDSSAFDEYLIVIDPSNNRVDVDGFYDEPEVFEDPNAEPGTYQIWANSYSPATGNYTLCVGTANQTPIPTNTPTVTPTPTLCTPPVAPAGPMPSDGATGVAPENVVLSWGNKGLEKVIYGNDDRLDIYQITDPEILSAADGTVVLVSRSSITDNHDGTYTLDSTTFNQQQAGNLCPDEPFRDQPAPGFCSGFLVAPDIVVTAGHCIENSADCSGTVFVFDFEMIDANTPQLVFPEDDVYFCSEIIDQRLVASTGEDWAVIRLDRPVVGHEPVAIRRTGKIADNQSVMVIGHPVGLPKKVAGGANVRSNNDSFFFVANLDTYGGNSGSPVFNADTLEVEGILVRGEDDFVTSGGCTRSNQCPDNGCRGEDCTRTTLFANLIPDLPGTTYDVYFGPCGSLALVGSVRGTAFSLNQSLLQDTTYCWKVVAKNPCGQAESAVWSFTTGIPPTGTATPSPTPTFSPTPSPTAFDASPDLDGSGVVDSGDLLQLIKNFRSVNGSRGSILDQLFTIARNWKRSVN